MIVITVIIISHDVVPFFRSPRAPHMVHVAHDNAASLHSAMRIKQQCHSYFVVIQRIPYSGPVQNALQSGRSGPCPGERAAVFLLR